MLRTYDLKVCVQHGCNSIEGGLLVLNKDLTDYRQNISIPVSMISSGKVVVCVSMSVAKVADKNSDSMNLFTYSLHSGNLRNMFQTDLLIQAHVSSAVGRG